jgi:nucleoside-diphosphate-sugar epimerase
MAADRQQLQLRNAFNLAAMSFSAGALAAEIKKHILGFTCIFQPDERQTIADSWPRSLDDTAARHQWNWRPEYDLSRMTIDMLKNLEAKKPAHSRE